jgi:hypothetical protein
MEGLRRAPAHACDRQSAGREHVFPRDVHDGDAVDAG